MKPRLPALLSALVLASCGGSAAPPPSAPAPNPPAASASAAIPVQAPSSAPDSAPSASESAAQPLPRTPPGPLTKESIRAVIHGWHAEIKGCYERRFRVSSALRGQVIARFVIGEDGKVASLDMSSSTMKADDVVECVGKLFALMEFPKPESGMVLITYPLDFSWEEHAE